MQYWVIKAEPNSRIVKEIDVKFSISDLENKGKTSWDGIRNYEARNNLKRMKKGDYCLFYHSNCKEPGIAGLARVCREHYVDDTQFDPKQPYYDPKSKKDDPKWYMVDVEFVSKCKFIPLETLKKAPELKEMKLLTRSRLSVSPVLKSEFDFIMDHLQ